MAGADDVVKAALKLIAGGSDDVAKPLRLYHGTRKYAENNQPFDYLSPDVKPEEFGLHLGSADQANQFSFAPKGENKEYTQGSPIEYPSGARVIPLDVGVKNPLRLEDRSGGWRPDEVYDQLVRIGKIKPNQDEWYDLLDKSVSGSDKDRFDALNRVRSLIEELGYDSIVYNNRYEGFPVEGNIRERFDKSGVYADEIGDVEYLNIVPEAKGNDSYIVWDKSLYRSPFGEGKGSGFTSGGRIAKGPGGIIDDVVKLAGKVISGEGDEAAQAGIRAYHGSPHDFDKFDMSKIGTGEGAQAFGHGLYFAEAEPVAESYRYIDARSDPDKVQYQGKPVAWYYEKAFQNKDRLDRARATGPEMSLANARAKFWEDMMVGKHPKQVLDESLSEDHGWPELVEYAKKIKLSDFSGAEPPGSMYEVNIAADPNTFLDWDKPLSEQPDIYEKLKSSGKLNVNEAVVAGTEKRLISLAGQLGINDLVPIRVQSGLRRGLSLSDALTEAKGATQNPEWSAQVDKLAEAILPTGVEMKGNLPQNWTGQSLVDSKVNGLTKRQVSEILSKEGIPGIKYLDAGSRSAGDGTRNYVVFDDKLISIIRKYGIAGASAMLGYNLMENLDSNQARAATAADMDYQSQKQAKANGGPVREGYQTKGRVLGNIVDQALKLATGAVEETAPKVMTQGLSDRLAQSAGVTGRYFPPGSEEYNRRLLEWHGDGKLVDEKGMPLRLYHQTPNDFDEFNINNTASGKAIWLTDSPENIPSGHNTRALRKEDGPYREGTNVMPLHARMKNPLYIDANNPEEAREIRKKFANGDGTFPQLMLPEWRSKLMEAGHDGVVFKNRSPFNNEYVVLEPEQLKSAIGNKGTFWPNLSRITKDQGGSVREGYQTKGRVVGDVVEQALKLIAGTGPELTAGGIRAYHGSPHYVERFDVGKIGTGEGNQSYGHGLYFAGKEDIARWYRDKLAGNSSKVVIGNETLPHWAIRDAAKAFSEIGYDPETSIMASYFVQKYGHDPVALNEAVAKNAKLPATVREAISRVNITPPSGHMYEVEIAADPNRLIDWNDPLKEQPADVRSAIMPFAEERADRMNKARREMLDRGVDMMGRPFSPKRLETLQQTADPETFTGENIYRHIQAQLGAGNVNDKAAEASQFLTEKGLHGIQYLDASSRGAGVIEPTKNFVIPEDKRISIIRRYADGGEVDDDVNDALRIAKDVGGGTPVMMEDAKGNKYDAQGNIIPQDNTGPNPQRSDMQATYNALLSSTPPEKEQSNYEVWQSLRPEERADFSQKYPDYAAQMRQQDIAASEKQVRDMPEPYRSMTHPLQRFQTSKGTAKINAPLLGGTYEYSAPDVSDYVTGQTTNPSQEYVQAIYDNKTLPFYFTPAAPLAATADVAEGVINQDPLQAAMAALGYNSVSNLFGKGVSAAGRAIYDAVKSHPYITGGVLGAGSLGVGSDEAEAGPARWFSKAVEVARDIPMNKMTGEQALAMLRKGTSPEELRWMGAEDFLSGQKSVSKDDLVAFLEKNRVQLNQINLGGSNKPTRLENIDIIDIPSEIRDRHPEVYSLSNRVEELRNELVKLRSMPDQSGLDYYDNFRAVSQEFSKTQADLMRAKDAIRKEYVESIGGLGRPTKYGPDSSHGETLTTPGGKNYSENLYALPQKDIYTPFVEQMRKDIWQQNYNEAIAGGFDEKRARKFADSFNNLRLSPDKMAKFLGRENELKSVYEAQKSFEPQYKGGHWGDVSPDVLFHTRTSELTYEPPGANRPYRVHSIEESQSDPGQAGRKRGFKDQKAMAEVARLRQQTQDLKAKLKSEQARLYDEHQKRIAPYVDERVRYERELRDKYKKGEISLGDMNRLAEAYGSPEPELTGKYRADTYQILNPILDQIASNEAEISRIGSKIGEIPMMPFISNTDAWTDRAIKHELDKAFDNGSDYFSWTPGEVHSDRYDLSRHIGRIDYNPDDGSLIAYNPEGRMVVNESVNDPSELDEYIGEELAQKLRVEADNRRSSIDEYEIDRDDETGEWSVSLYGEPSYDYNGEPLLFRSKGEARDYLNEMMANEFAEQPVTLSGLDIKTGGEGMIGYYDKIFLKRVQEVIRKATGQKPVIETIEVQTANGPRKQLGIRLTDEMREKARFSDFKKGGRVTGGNTYGNDNSVAHALALTSEY